MKVGLLGLRDEETLTGQDIPRPRSHSLSRLLDGQLEDARLGHYLLLNKLGDGGMGVVYEALDERLARRVALKLMRSRGSTLAQRRFVREARAMAQLSHPNVVQVYEIGEVGALTFIVMELIEGMTLRHWLKQQRSEAEILAVFADAGEGLVAAHRAGLVHRDFKPDNVMIGAEGRVVVMDFGLARHDPGEEGKADGEDEEMSSFNRARDGLELTATGTLLGTPAYMAPEQFMARGTDAHSDQFSFCVALWEAVHGHRPFMGSDFETLASSVITGRYRQLQRPASAWLRRVLLRGLSVDPLQRWPSMEALIAALRRGRRRREALSLVGVAAATVALIVGLSLGTRARATESSRAACEAQAQELAEGWLRAQEQLAPRISSVDVGSWDRLDALLGDYVADWTLQRSRGCMGAREAGASVHAEQVGRCLELRGATFETLVDGWAEREVWTLAQLAHASTVAQSLAPLSSCGEASGLSEGPVPSDPQLGQRLAELRVELSRVSALRMLERHDEADARLDELAEAAQELGEVPLRVEVELERARLLELQGEYRRTRELLRAAHLDAMGVGDEQATLEIATLLSIIEGERLSNPDSGLYWGAIATRLIARGELEGTAWEARLLGNLGQVHATAGDYTSALELHRQARALRERLYGAEHPLVASSHNEIGSVLGHQGHVEEALASHARAREIYARQLGAEHPDIAISWNNSAVIEARRGAYETARAAFREALRIWEVTHGSEHPYVAKSLVGLAQLHEVDGEHAQAHTLYARSLGLWQRFAGEEDPALIYPLSGLARTHAALGRDALARQAYARVLMLDANGQANTGLVAAARAWLEDTPASR